MTPNVMLPMNNLGIVKRHIVRAEKAAVARLAKLGVATIHEAMGRVGLMKPYMRPVYKGANICGTAVTILLQPGDNWMMHVAAEQLQPGDVAVAACTTDNDDGFFGDLLATSFQARGAVGLVIDGGVGDVVIADIDGVVVVPAALAAQVADAAEKRESFEGEKRARFAAGELGLDMYNMRGPLEKAGLKYID
jgi:4-hydroxy-4-methyl-2-oxoglutarate aldolase